MAHSSTHGEPRRCRPPPGPSGRLRRRHLPARCAGAVDQPRHGLGQQGRSNMKHELDVTYQRQQQALKVTDLAPVEVHADPKQTAALAPTPASPRRSTPQDADHPDHPDHPDHALYEKVRGAVEQLDRHAGKPWDQQSERMTASALALPWRWRRSSSPKTTSAWSSTNPARTWPRARRCTSTESAMPTPTPRCTLPA